MKHATLLFLINDKQILLAMKKRGFGAGRWNGVGGKPNEAESITDAALRECQEEIGVTPIEIQEVAILNFYFPESKKSWNQQVTTYICRDWEGVPIETEEMAPKWFNIDEIPYSKMWPDDKHWLPKVIKGEYVKADFYFDDNDKLIKYSMNT